MNSVAMPDFDPVEILRLPTKRLAPEQKLALAIIEDAINKLRYPPESEDYCAAHRWLTENGRGFQFWMDALGLDSETYARKFQTLTPRTVLLRLREVHPVKGRANQFRHGRSLTRRTQ